MSGRCFLNCILTINHSWIICMNLKEFFFKYLILVVLHHHVSYWPTAYISINFYNNYTYLFEYKENKTIASPKKHIYVLYHNPFVGQRICLYLRKSTSKIKPVTHSFFCFHDTPKWAIKLTKQKNREFTGRSSSSTCICTCTCTLNVDTCIFFISSDFRTQ